MPDSSFDPWGHDDWMDAQLRDVRLPRDLNARLRAARRGADVPAEAPPRQEPESDPFDARLDALLRNVEVPVQLERELKAIARPAWPWVGRDFSRGVWAAAASVALFATVGIYLSLVGNGKELATTATSLAEPPDTEPGLPSPPDEALAAESPPPAAEMPTRQVPITVPLGQPQLAEDNPRKLFASVSGVTNSIRQAIEAKRLAQTTLGAHGQIEPLPALAILEPPVARGIAPPRVRGYDYLFQLRQGEHPVVSPAANKALEITSLPFSFRTVSYDQASEAIAAGRLPAREQIRVEDFLAAQQYLLPPAPNQGLALHAGGCPSPLVDGRQLLQLTIQGAQQTRQRPRPAHLVVLVETSAAMQAAAYDNLVVRALARLGRSLEAQDKVTLIGYSAAPRVLLEGSGREALLALAASGGLEVTAGGADVVAALDAAADAMSGLPAGEDRHVILVSADAAPHPTRVEVLQAALDKFAASRTPWHFVGLSVADDGAGWHDLARQARGRASQIQSADELYAVCYESLCGRGSLVARGTAVRVAFNPKCVASYRLLGHEAVTLTGDTENSLVVDLHAEQAATGMFEIVLRPDAKGDLGMVELMWSDPHSGQQRRRVQPLKVDALASSFAQAPAWVQQGVLAARTAEMLRGSYYVPNSRRVGQLLDLAGEVQTSVAKSPDFRGLVRLIQQADRLR